MEKEEELECSEGKGIETGGMGTWWEEDRGPREGSTYMVEI